MKTAVSVPDDAFQKAERLAKREGRSRSEVYSAAFREYVALGDDAASDVFVRAAAAWTLESTRDTGLPRGSVANVTRLLTLDRAALSEPVGRS